jgi:hypothetical protein
MFGKGTSASAFTEEEIDDGSKSMQLLLATASTTIVNFRSLAYLNPS